MRGLMTLFGLFTVAVLPDSTRFTRCAKWTTAA